MPNLAGFDLICELSLNTIRDIVNESQVKLPNGDAVYLLGGRFELIYPLSLPQGGTALLRAYCDATLDAIPRTASCRLTLRITKGSMDLGLLTLAHLSGTVSFDVPIGFVKRPLQDSNLLVVVPSLLTQSATDSVDFDKSTERSLDETFGDDTSDKFKETLKKEFLNWLQSQQTTDFSGIRFSVVEGVDSSSLMQLSALPELLWIDNETLGIFGYYKASATGGNPAQKTDNDIVEYAPDDYKYSSGIYGAVPARRISVLLSPAGFKLIFGCPTIRNDFIRPLVKKNHEDTYKAQVRDQMGAKFFDQESQKHLKQYQAEEAQKSPNDLEGATNRARDRVQEDANRDIENEATSRLEAWLDGLEGQKEINDSTPPSCGNGSIVADRDGDTVAILRRLDLELDDGFIRIEALAGGDLPKCGSFSVTQKGQLRLYATEHDIKPVLHLDHADPDIDRSALCAAAAAFLGTLFVGLTMGVGLTFLTFSIAEGIAKSAIAEAVDDHPPKKPEPFNFDGSPLKTRFTDVQIKPNGVSIFMSPSESFHFNNFRPRLELTSTQVSRIAVGDVSKGSFHVEPWKSSVVPNLSCPAQTFEYSHQRYNTSFHVSINPIDLPLPITVQHWRLRLGNRMFIMENLREADITWSGTECEISSPITVLHGETWQLIPPFGGKFVAHDVQVKVDGSIDHECTLSFSAIDGYFYVLVSVDAIDADRNRWEGTTFIGVDGDEVIFGDEYWAWKKDCDEKKDRDWDMRMALLPPLKVNTRIPPGVPVEEPKKMLAIVVREAIRSGDPNAHDLLTAAVKQYGKEMLPLLESVVPLSSLSNVNALNMRR